MVHCCTVGHGNNTNQSQRNETEKISSFYNCLATIFIPANTTMGALNSEHWLLWIWPYTADKSFSEPWMWILHISNTWHATVKGTVFYCQELTVHPTHHMTNNSWTWKLTVDSLSIKLRLGLQCSGFLFSPFYLCRLERISIIKLKISIVHQTRISFNLDQCNKKKWFKATMLLKNYGCSV